MTAAEIAETLINGNIADAREAIVGYHDGDPVLVLDVAGEYILRGGTIAALRRCLTGGT